MTRKDYVAIAKAFSLSSPRGRYAEGVNWLRTSEQWRIDIHNIASVLKADNPRFKTDVFYRACGLKGDE